MTHSHRTTRFAVLVLVLTGALINTGPHASARRISAKSNPALQLDMVLEWNANAAGAIVGVAGLRPERGLIRLAMVHLAIYDAVNAIDGYPFQAYGVHPTVISPASV